MSRNARSLVAAGLLAGLWLLTSPALAVQPDEMLPDPALELRAREVSKELRCVVCQNENIDESNADLARDLRLLVRDRLTKGDSNDEVINFVVARYGDYVLLRPPFKLSTYALWFGPLVFVLLAGFGAWRFYRRPATPTPEAPTAAAPAPLSEAEKKRLERLLNSEDNA
jgi:cytochrome c-type biogenesis protein CcmH